MEEIKREKEYVVYGEDDNNLSELIISLGVTENGLRYIRVPITDNSLDADKAIISDVTGKLLDEDVPEEELQEGIEWFQSSL